MNSRTPTTTTRRRLLATGLVVVALLLSLVAAATFSAFSATTGNSGNNASAGTVSLTDNDSSAAIFNLAGMIPGDTDSGCIQVTYTGSVPALVRLYGTTTGSGLDPYVDMTVTRGTIGSGSFDSCTGFVPDATDWIGQGPGVLYAGSLQGFGDTWAAGTVDARPAVPEAWTTGEIHTYKIQLTLQDTNAAQNKTATQTFTWEARNTTLYSQVILSDNPAGYWKLDETSGTTATDATGAHNGTYGGTPTLNRTTGAKDAGTAVQFDGSDDLMSAGDFYDYSGTASFSAEFWFSPASTNGRYQYVVTKNGWGTGWGFKIAADWDATNPSKLAFERLDASGSGGDGAISTTTPQVGSWYHVVGTYDGANMRLYVNGVLERTLASTRSVGNHPDPFRLSLDAAGGQFDGLLDEVAVYGSVLSQQQITEHYQAGRR